MLSKNVINVNDDIDVLNLCAIILKNTLETGVVFEKQATQGNTEVI
jgi:hypothetical protein